MDPGRARRIAIADDSPTFVDAAASYIAALPGYALAGTVHATANALTLVTSSAPDVLLLGLGPAPARGLDLLRRVKALPSAPAVVAMTLFHSPEAAAAAIGAGAVGLVGKDGFVPGLTQLLARLFPAQIAA
ncbi:MAG TPA: response regulator [Burkholderiales bacterium]|jgi:DNA-binding NarL/FixJ family response regulator